MKFKVNLPTVIIVVIAQAILTGALLYGQQTALERKRINMVGWRNIPDAPKTTQVMVLEDTLSKTEFLLVYFNGDVVMNMIPKSSGETPSTPMPIIPSTTFKSSW